MSFSILGRTIRTSKSLKRVIQAGLQAPSCNETILEQMIGVYNASFLGLCIYRTTANWKGKSYFLKKDTTI